MGGGVSLNGKTILDLTYPISSLYISKENVSPASLFGGTWEQLTADAYFKIVSSNGGNLGGTSSDHRIPIASMPSHNHLLSLNIDNRWACWTCAEGGMYVPQGGGTWEYVTNNTGGGQSYYPYYYGVYAWIRIS